jgi:hypothetical protein
VILRGFEEGTSAAWHQRRPLGPMAKQGILTGEARNARRAARHSEARLGGTGASTRCCDLPLKTTTDLHPFFESPKSPFASPPGASFITLQPSPRFGGALGRSVYRRSPRFEHGQRRVRHQHAPGGAAARGHLLDLLRAGDTLVDGWTGSGETMRKCDTVRQFMRRGVVIKTVEQMERDVPWGDASGRRRMSRTCRAESLIALASGN